MIFVKYLLGVESSFIYKIFVSLFFTNNLNILNYLHIMGKWDIFTSGVNCTHKE